MNQKCDQCQNKLVHYSDYEHNVPICTNVVCDNFCIVSIGREIYMRYLDFNDKSTANENEEMINLSN